MTLIACPECDKEVSDRAPVCPSCGTPIASARDFKQAGAALTTIQETSKKFKARILMSAGLFWGGLILAGAAGDDGGAVGGIAMVVGLVLYIVTKFNVWWHHK